MKKFITAAFTASLIILNASNSFAAKSEEIEMLKQEIANMRNSYEQRIDNLEKKLEQVMASKAAPTAGAPNAAPKNVSNRNIYDSSFNPSIGVILNGKYANFSKDSSELAGFAIGEEGERGREGVAIDESELNFSANVDDKFFGSLTAAIVREDGQDKLELEESYIETLPGAGLPTGAGIKAGRAFWTLGYLNEQHTHSDDFADRPLPYRAFLNKAFNDDGVEFSYVLPFDFYSEIGAGIFRGDDFPGGGSDGEGASSHSAFARIGGDITHNQSWRLGAYWLSSEIDSRGGNEDAVTFIGNNDLFAADLKYTFAPTGNPKEQEIILQGEYFARYEDGTYEDTGASTGAVDYDDNQSGWYVQSVYKFLPQWRVGVRYSRLHTSDVPTGLVGSALDADGHDPETYTAMADWSNSEFSRVRLQFNHEELSKGNYDNQVMVQYILSLGAHAAHTY